MRFTTNEEMKLISRAELKEKLDRGDHFKLVMAYEPWAFRMKHIPRSINIPVLSILASDLKALGLDDEIVVYCSGEECGASKLAYFMLRAQGHENVRRYAGGVADWESAGCPLEGQASATLLAVS